MLETVKGAPSDKGGTWGPMPESFMSGLDRLQNLRHSSVSSDRFCEPVVEARSSSFSLSDPASLLSEMNRVWEGLSLNASRVHHLLRDQIYNGGEVISERLESLGEPGDTLRAGALLIFLERNPALWVDQFH